MMWAFVVPARAVGWFDRAPFLWRNFVFAGEWPSSFWSAFQMRLTAVLRSVNRFTGVTPGRLFQRRTRRVAGHGSARWPRVWPTINDQDSARRAVERAARITTVWAVVNAAIGLISMFSGSRITERSPVEWQGRVLDNGGDRVSGVAFLLCGILFGLGAWEIRSMSPGWTLGGRVL